MHITLFTSWSEFCLKTFKTIFMMLCTLGSCQVSRSRLAWAFLCEFLMFLYNYFLKQDSCSTHLKFNYKCSCFTRNIRWYTKSILIINFTNRMADFVHDCPFPPASRCQRNTIATWKATDGWRTPKNQRRKKKKNLTNQIIKSMDWFVTSLLILEAQF